MAVGKKKKQSDIDIEQTIGAVLEPAWLYPDLGEDLSKNPLEILAETVEKYHCRGAVVHLGDVSEIRRLGCKKIIVVSDFPYGRNGAWGKRLDATWADNSDGVIGIDVVINLQALQKADWETIRNELMTVKTDKEIKAICQMPFVWQYHRKLIPDLLDVLNESGVNVVKDWTTVDNFSKPVKADVETRIEYIKYLRALIDKERYSLLIKIAGKVDENNVVAFKEAGADIFGVSCHKIIGVFEALKKLS